MTKKKQSLFTKIFSRRPKKAIDLNDNTIVTPTQMIVNNFKENKLAIFGLIGFILVMLFTFVGSAFVKFDVNYTQTTLRNIAPGNNHLAIPSHLNGKVKKIAAGTSFGFAIDTDGQLHSWGTDKSGVLNIPETAKTKKFKDVAVSNQHVIALTTSGDVMMWGDNSADQSKLDPIYEVKMSAAGVDKVFAGPLYSGVLLGNKKIITWGSNSVQQLSINAEWDGHIVDVATTTENMILLLDDGTVRVTGGNILSSSLPAELTDGRVKAKKIAASYLNGLVLTENNKLISWGASDKGLEIKEQFTKTVKDIKAGYNHFLILFEDGTITTVGTQTAYGEDKVPQVSDVTAIYAGYFQNYAVRSNAVDAWGLSGFILGSDELGRDVLTRLMNGGKTSLLVGIVAVVITTIIGVTVGLIAGFVGGAVDNLLMRFAEIITSIPFLPLLITLSAVLGNSLNPSQRMYLVMVIIGVLSWVGLARLIRGQILIEREKDFILAARALGIRESKIILKHILPSILSIVIVNMTLSYGGMMLTEAGLSFLGFGVVQPTPTWGNMLNGAQSAEVIQFYWWRWLFPALAVFLTVLCVNLVGDGLRDAVDPKSNQK
ncbi:ABC transporter permease subunit [Carnobacteriaceae bacterium zg-C25]|nr:ABC transporter permease subunit [Carnobacteriaceae bacterium zg-C25]